MLPGHSSGTADQPPGSPGNAPVHNIEEDREASNSYTHMYICSYIHANIVVLLVTMCIHCGASLREYSRLHEEMILAEDNT